MGRPGENPKSPINCQVFAKKGKIIGFFYLLPNKTIPTCNGDVWLEEGLFFCMAGPSPSDNFDFLRLFVSL